MDQTSGLQVPLYPMAFGFHVPLWVEVLVLVVAAAALAATVLILTRSRR